MIFKKNGVHTKGEIDKLNTFIIYDDIKNSYVNKFLKSRSKKRNIEMSLNISSPKNHEDSNEPALQKNRIEQAD